MYISIFYDLIIPEDLENYNKQLKVRNNSFAIFPQKKIALGYSFHKYEISNYFKHKTSILLIEEWYGLQICIIQKYRYGDIINNKIEKYSNLDTIIRNLINELRNNRNNYNFDRSIDLSKLIPEYMLYIKNSTNKICKFNEPIYEITETGSITKKHLIYDRIAFKFWDKVENRFEFLIGTKISDIEKHKQLFSKDYYSFAKPKTKCV